MPREHSKTRLTLHFRVRPVLVRWIVSALCLFLTVLIVPHVYFSGDYPILSWLIISAVFGLLTTFVKPLVQLVLLPLIFVSYGLVIVLINTLIIWFLSVIFPERFHVEHILWAFVAGLVSGAARSACSRTSSASRRRSSRAVRRRSRRRWPRPSRGASRRNCWTRPVAARRSSSATATVITAVTRPDAERPGEERS